MPNNTVNTGHGAELTFSIGQWAFNWTTITPGDTTIPDVDASHLATPSNRQYIPGDLIDDGVITVEFQFDSAADLPTVGTFDQALIKWPQGPDETSQAQLLGSCYINSLTINSFVTDELQVGTLVIRFTGTPAPVYTPATKTP